MASFAYGKFSIVIREKLYNENKWEAGISINNEKNTLLRAEQKYFDKRRGSKH